MQFRSDNAAALSGVHQVPEAYSPVCPTSQHHRTVVYDAGGEGPHCLLLTRLEGMQVIRGRARAGAGAIGLGLGQGRVKMRSHSMHTQFSELNWR